MQTGNSGGGMKRGKTNSIYRQMSRPGGRISVHKEPAEVFNFRHKPDMSKVEVVKKRPRAIKK